jgi:hypothetical protein
MLERGSKMPCHPLFPVAPLRKTNHARVSFLNCFSVTIDDDVVKEREKSHCLRRVCHRPREERIIVGGGRHRLSFIGIAIDSPREVIITPKTKGSRFTSKEHRQAEHIKESEEERGMSEDRAKEVGWATVNKERSKKHSS